MQVFLRKIILAIGMIGVWYTTTIHCSDAQMHLYNECYQPVRSVLRLANEDLRRFRLGEDIPWHSYVHQISGIELAAPSTRAVIARYDTVTHNIIAQLIAGNNTLKLHRAFVAAMFELFEEAVISLLEKKADEQQCETIFQCFCRTSFDVEQADEIFRFFSGLLNSIVDGARMVSIMAVSAEESAGIRRFIRKQHYQLAHRLREVLGADPALLPATNFFVQKPEEEGICTSETLLAYPKQAIAMMMEMFDAMEGYGLKMVDA